MSNRLILLFGPPQSGKGTYSRMLSRKFETPCVCAGEAIREKLRQNESWFEGQYSMEMHDRGEFCPPELVKKLVFELADRVEGPYFLDGYPRSLRQLKDLLFLNIPFMVVHLNVPEEDLVTRARGRRICGVCGEVYNIDNPHMQPGQNGKCVVKGCGGELVRRGDDSEDVVRARARKYRIETAPVLDACQDLLASELCLLSVGGNDRCSDLQ